MIVLFVFFKLGGDGLVGLRRVFAESSTIHHIVDVCSFNGLQQNEQKDLAQLGLILVLDSGQVRLITKPLEFCLQRKIIQLNVLKAYIYV